jgi:hypothetical protein
MDSGNKLPDLDIMKLIPNIMNRLCNDYRIRAQNSQDIYFDIEEFRQNYVETTSPETFRIIIEKISNMNKEIEVDGNKMKLTLHGINNCKIYDPFFI